MQNPTIPPPGSQWWLPLGPNQVIAELNTKYQYECRKVLNPLLLRASCALARRGGDRSILCQHFQITGVQERETIMAISQVQAEDVVELETTNNNLVILDQPKPQLRLQGNTIHCLLQTSDEVVVEAGKQEEDLFSLIDTKSGDEGCSPYCVLVEEKVVTISEEEERESSTIYSDPLLCSINRPSSIILIGYIYIFHLKIVFAPFLIFW